MSSRIPSEARETMLAAHAVVIGISSYTHLPQVPASVVAGAGRVAETLVDPQLCGYPEEQVRLLVDQHATREAILEELRIASVLEPDATLLVYFAGHGGVAEDGETYLLPVEADPERLASTAISGRELSEVLATTGSGRLLVVFDCCHAGGLGTPPPASLRGLPEDYCAALGDGRGRVVLASARDHERSWMASDDESTVFTGHLLAALRGGAGRGRWLRVWDLFEYVQPRVVSDQPDQHPVFKADLEENFPIALRMGGLEADDVDHLGERQTYHAYVSYADREPDASWVWDRLLPQLEDAGVTAAVSDDVEQPGVFRVVGAERGIRRSRRVILVLSDNYLADEMTGFVDALAQSLGVEEGIARLLPVCFAPFDASSLPARLRLLVRLDLGHPRRADRNMNRLVAALVAPPPIGA